MTKPSHEHSIEHEPHMQPGSHASADPSEQKADRTLSKNRGDTSREYAQQSVFEEPMAVCVAAGDAIAQTDRPCPRCGYNCIALPVKTDCPQCGFAFSGNYAAWLNHKLATTSAHQAWLTVAALVAAAGIFAVLGTFIAALSNDWGLGLTAIVIVGPATEEVMKVVLVWMCIELKPYLFRTVGMVWVATLAGALGFAIIENLLYLFVYVPDASAALIAWRWTVCTALHVGCTTIATLGLVNMWRHVMVSRKSSVVATVTPYITTAIIVHGTYNGLVIALEAGGLTF